MISRMHCVKVLSENVGNETITYNPASLNCHLARLILFSSKPKDYSCQASIKKLLVSDLNQRWLIIAGLHNPKYLIFCWSEAPSQAHLVGEQKLKAVTKKQTEYADDILVCFFLERGRRGL